jgi:triosephosphate isomerase
MIKFIVGNWKMNPTNYTDAVALARKIKTIATKAEPLKVRAVVCPPMPFLSGVSSITKTGGLSLGSQNSHKSSDGAHTGETSPSQLKSIGVSYVILGHSERRAAGESDTDVAAKMPAAIKEKLNIILCVGEKVRDSRGEYFKEIAAQLQSSLGDFPATKTGQLIIAYEPIWAIGEKAQRPATPEDFREVEMLLRRELAAKFGKTRAFKIPILYGGSVSKDNAQSFINIGADGLLVGRTSLDADAFTSIIKTAMTQK